MQMVLVKLQDHSMPWQAADPRPFDLISCNCSRLKESNQSQAIKGH